LAQADRYIKANTDDLFALSSAQQDFHIRKAYVGVGLVPDVHRLTLMNLSA
jgi:type I restriction enzyme M protein